MPQCSYTYLYATKTASGARITWTVFMQNKTITFRLKKHFEPVKGLLLRFLFFPPVISHIPTTLRRRRRSLSISHVSTTNAHTHTAHKHDRRVCSATIINGCFTPFAAGRNTARAKRLLFFIILHTHTHIHTHVIHRRIHLYTAYTTTKTTIIIIV